jgi:hypothetical protein
VASVESDELAEVLTTAAACVSPTDGGANE